jgi:Secretion system C-terminal sorting domain
MRKFANYITATVSVVLFFSCTGKQESPIPEEDEMDDVELAIRQELRMTRDPHTNTVPSERLITAKNYMNSLQARVTNIAALTWQERGPNNVGGRTRAIMIDRRDATGNTVFAGSVSGGLFKSTNFTSASATWTPVNDFISNLAITCLLQDRNNANIMYAGTGEGWFNIDAVKGNGILKSTDGGVTWNVLPSTVITTPAVLTFEYVQDLAQDNNGNIYASIRNIIGSSRGVQRSTDGGTTWTQVLGAPISGFVTGRATDLEVASNGDVYACLGIFGRSMVWKSSFSTHGANTGAFGNWVEVTPPRSTVTQRVELAIAPTNPQKLYLLMQDSANDTQVGAIYRSANGGTTWDSLGAPGELNNGTNSQAWYNLIAAVSPTNENVVVVGGLSLAKTTDGGNTWTGISTSGTVHVDQHALVFNGDTKLLVGNDGGIYYSDNINLPAPSFVTKNNGFNCTQYYGVDLHPTDPNYFLAGAQDNGTQKFTTAGINTTTNASGGDGGWPHIDQTDGQLQITANTGNRYNVSTNGGASFNFASTVFNTRGQFINPTDFDDQSDVLYCGDDEGKYFFIRNWATTPVGTQVTVAGFGTREVTFVKVDPNGGNNVWIGLTSVNRPNTPLVPPVVMKLSSANTTLPTIASISIIGTTVTTDSNYSVGAALSSLDIDPSNSNHIIATLSNYGVRSIWESTDGGSTFNHIEGNLPDMPVWWCMFAPAGAQLNGPTGGNGGILLGTDLGVWTTSQLNGRFTQWMPNNAGLANVRTYMLKYRSSDRTLVAASHGRGLFTTTLTVTVTGVPNVPNTKDFIKNVSADKNQLQVVVGNLNTKNITLQLFDMNGRLMLQRRQAYANTLLDVSRYTSGSYIIKIRGDKNERFVKQVVK